MTTSRTTTATAKLSTLLQQTVALLHQRSAGDTLAIMNDVGLTMPQMVTLFVLRRLGPHFVCDIADRLHLSRAATSHLVDRLVRADLVARTEGTDDRRQKRVTITERGLALLARLDQSRLRELTSAVAMLSPQLQNAFANVLTQVITELGPEAHATDQPAQPVVASVRVNSSGPLRKRK